MADDRRARIEASLGRGDLQWWRAPGRVNLIGDHTDYQDGLCAPMAIGVEVLVGGRTTSAHTVRLRSLDLGGEAEVPIDAPPAPGNVTPPWARTLAAAVRLLGEWGVALRGFEGAVASTVPIGSGLSSSAAFSVGLCLALSDAAGAPVEGTPLALVAQAVDQVAYGVPCGVLDQMAAVHGRAGHALRLDCRSLAVEAVRIPPEAEFVVMHSGVPRILADSEYAARRAACEAAAARLGIPTLRDATYAQVAQDPLARHVVSENARVDAFLDALRRADLRETGRLMVESHASLRDDYRVSTAELDLLVDLLRSHGALGARLTGAGFGGCVVALGRAGDTAAIAARVAAEYRRRTGFDAAVIPVAAVGGASRASAA
jgi:galactokinase